MLRRGQRRGQRRGRFGLGVAALLSALLSALWFGMAADRFRGSGRVPVLANLRGTGPKPDDYPSVSVVVAARNEKEVVEAAVPAGAGLPRAPGGHRPRRPLDRWDGRRYGRPRGPDAGEAEGGWLLFTDADVRFAPDCVELAVCHAVSEGFDHLALAPELVSRGTALKSFIAAFVLVFELS